MKKTTISIAVCAALPLSVFASETIDADIDLKNVPNGIVVQDGVEKIYTGNSISVDVSNRGINVTKDNSLTVGTLETTDKVKIKSNYIGIAAFGNPGHDGASVNLAAKNVFISASSESGESFGIIIQNNTKPSTITSDKRATVNIASVNGTYIDAYSGNTDAEFNQASAIAAFSQSVVNIDGDLFVNTQGGNGNAIQARGDARIDINSSGKGRVVINGDIAFSVGDNSGTGPDANVNIKLIGKDSSWTGNSTFIWGVGITDAMLKVEKNLVLTLADGATWTPTATTNDPITNGKGTRYTNLNDLTLSGGSINITGNSIDVAVNKFKGDGNINLATNLEELEGNQSGTFTILSSEKDSSVAVNLMDKSMTRILTADEIQPDQASSLKKNVTGQGVDITTTVPEGMVEPGYGLDNSDQVHLNEVNTLMQSSLELASAAPLALNRILMNDVRKRLGDIRTAEGTSGAWVRYDGGRLSGQGGLKNDFNTIQLGIDTVPTADAPRFGLTFSYTDSDAEYARGKADMTAYSLALYGTKVFDNGMFVDLIGRLGTADTDLLVDGQYKGSMDNNVLGVSGELGWRYDLTKTIFIEPQTELTYTYVDSEHLKLNTASYEIDAMTSLMGRLGFSTGLQCPENRGNIYMRLSVVHEFLGDSKISGTNLGKTAVYEIDGKDTWLEYGIGANFNITPSTYIWGDIERTNGGVLDEDYRATIGARYVF